MFTALRARLAPVAYSAHPSDIQPERYPDLTNFREIVPAQNWTVNPYQTFWQGNQLPSFMPTAIPHPQYVRIRDQAITQAQRGGGSFAPLSGYMLGQQGTARSLGVMRALWARAQYVAYQDNNQ